MADGLTIKFPGDKESHASCTKLIVCLLINLLAVNFFHCSDDFYPGSVIRDSLRELLSSGS